jgi:hypothetical protein
MGAQKPKPSTSELLALYREAGDLYRRNAERWDLARFIGTARQGGLRITWDELLALGTVGFGDMIGNTVPGFVASFIASYAAKRQPTSILDGWAGMGSLIIPIVDVVTPASAVGITPSANELAVAKEMTGDVAITWIQAHPDGWPALGSFDLIASSPPINMPASELTIHTDRSSLTIRDSASYTFLLQSAMHLSDDGVGFFLVPNGFFSRDGKALVREALPLLGLHLNAVIALPAGTFASTSIPLNIVLISRIPAGDLFVGQLSPATDQKALLKNLLERKHGPSLELGRLIPNGTFTSFSILQTADEEDRLAKRSGLTRSPLREVVSSINLGKQTDDGGFANLPNCVYLPTIGTSSAVTGLESLQIKPHNYVQLVVRPEVAHAEFLAGFFNSALGRKTRATMFSGTFIPKLSKQTVTEGHVYLLPLDAQQNAMTVSREIQELRLRLEQLERDLWSRPVDAINVKRAVAGLNQKEGFESWLEALPFPLASILWRYQAANIAEHKVEHLFNAFEATAQFLGTLMASAFHSSPVFFREHRAEWFDQGKDNPFSLTRSSFGQWVVRCQRLAKSTRQMLSDKERRELVLDLYRADAEKVERLSNKGIYAVLETVSQYRNKWKGHSGIVSAKEHDRQLALLQEELTRLRTALGGLFEDWWLIKPGANTYTRGVYQSHAEKLMGTRQIFKQETVVTAEVMDVNELYCYDHLTRRPLELLHFVRMLPAPDNEEIACYFFNRLEGQRIRWISYHFEREAERIEADAAVMRVIEEAENSFAT